MNITGFLLSPQVPMRGNMVLTHAAEGRDALTHVLTNVFEVGVNHPLALALEKSGYHDIHDISYCHVVLWILKHWFTRMIKAK
jgi:hypothetical protein